MLMAAAPSALSRDAEEQVARAKIVHPKKFRRKPRGCSCGGAYRLVSNWSTIHRHKADVGPALMMSALRGKTDMTRTSRYVR